MKYIAVVVPQHGNVIHRIHALVATVMLDWCPHSSKNLYSPGGRMKDFIEQLNELVAPITRAYSEPEIISVKIAPGDIKDDTAEFALIIRCKRAGWDAGPYRDGTR